eukprot:gene2315-8605_t
MKIAKDARANEERYGKDMKAKDDELKEKLKQKDDELKLLDQLVERRSDVPDRDPELSRLDGMIIPLTTITRRMFSAGPYNIVQDSPPSSPEAQEGSMLQDLKELNLYQQASGLLDVKYLSATPAVEEGGVWPVEGVLWGPCKRPLVCLPTQLRASMPCVNVIYLVDTGAPMCELSPTAFSALGSDVVPPQATRGFINGVRCHVQLCAQDGNHPDIPVLGADYLTSIGAVVSVDYRQGTISLRRS